MTTRYYVPLLSNQRPASLARRVERGERVEGRATLPAYTSKERP